MDLWVVQTVASADTIHGLEIVTSVCTALRWKEAPELLDLPISVLGSLSDKAALLKEGPKTQQVYLTWRLLMWWLLFARVGAQVPRM